MTYLKDFVEHCINNSVETMEYYDDITITREYNTPEMDEFRKVVNTYFNKFCFNNGLFQKNRLRIEELEPAQKTFLTLIGLINEAPKNRYHQHILKYYFSKLESKIEDVKLEDLGIKFMDNYYQDLPPIYVKLSKLKWNDIKPQTTKEASETLNNLLKHVKEFIIIGSSIQFNIDGFPRNEMLYLLYGLAICSAMSKSFNNFKDLINHLKSFIQLYLPTKCFNPINYEAKGLEEKEVVNDNYYNLITYLKTKDGNYNYRYKCAEKYYDGKTIEDKQTKYIKGEEGSKGTIEQGSSEYLLTVYKTKDDMVKIWDKLEEEYKKDPLHISDELIAMWFDGQLLTRSTCLIGCMLIIMKHLRTGERIIFKPDEMPDWCSIAGKDFNTTFETKEIPKDFKESFADWFDDLTLKDVLDILKIYVLNIRK